MLKGMLDDLRNSLSLFETTNPEVAHLVNLVEELRDIASTLNYKVEKLEKELENLKGENDGKM
ncbi:MAG: hypothetical protein OXN27_25770 [Candidatus Poribacteria bacterium]|nr:hypothetical protein [Candidatus Poribacteria bacterium]